MNNNDFNLNLTFSINLNQLTILRVALSKQLLAERNLLAKLEKTGDTSSDSYQHQKQEVEYAWDLFRKVWSSSILDEYKEVSK